MTTDTVFLKKLLGDGWNITVFDSIDSTNVRLLADVKAGSADTGTVYIAETQSAGRGRLGRSFISPTGGIYMSFCAGDAEHALSTVICAVAVAESLESFGFSPKIKWVNDILIGSKKVCGILAQSAGDGKRAVIGVGINLSAEKIPEGLREIADGLDSYSKTVPKKEDLAADILRRYKKLSNSLPDGRDNIISRYKSYMAMLGDYVTVLQTGETVLVRDIHNTGALITETEEGKILRLNSGEISIRKITTN